MAKKQSSTSENSAAEQGAKPGMFIPIPTAEVTNAAEMARIRAEKEAEEARIRAEKEAKERAEKESKEKADRKKADAVATLIGVIGVVEYTDACHKKIEAAKQAYNQLTQEQKSLVENGDVFIASVIKYKELEVAAAKAEEARKKAEKEAEIARIRAEREAKQKVDKKAADAVVALIRAIGVVEYTDACLKKINAAKQAYVKLTADQNKLVDNADVITTSEKEYDKLKNAAKKAEEAARKKAEKEAKEKADKEAADAVVALIRAIGVVEYTDACLKKINAAKQAYTKLTVDQRSHVKNEKVLTASEDKYNELAIADADAEKARKREAARKKTEEAARKKAEEAARKKAEEFSKKRKKHIVTIVWVICCIIGFCILVKMCSSDSLSEDETEYIIEADDLQEDIIDLQLDDSKDLPASNTSSPESEKNDWKSKYDYVYPLSDGVYKVEKRNKKGFCDKNGKVLLPCEYDYIYNKDDGLYKVEKSSKKGFVDAKTYKVLAPCEYDYIYSASNGLIKVEKGDKKGFLNAQTYKLVTPCIYDYIYSPSGGLIKVEIGSKTGYLNMDGSVAKQPV